MDSHPTFKVLDNWWIQPARAAEANLRISRETYGAVPESWRAMQIDWIQAVALYGGMVCWDREGARSDDDLQCLLNRQARSILGMLPTTPWGALITEAGLTPTSVILDYRQQQFAARLANACVTMLKKLHQNPSSSALICRVGNQEHEHGRTTKRMNSAAPGEESVVRMFILDDEIAAKRAAQCCAREKEAKLEQGSRCGEKRDYAQMMATWEQPQCAKRDVNWGPVAGIWEVNIWTTLMQSSGWLDLHSMSRSRSEK